MAEDQKESTKRAALLLRALDCINANDYDDRGGYIIFGKGLGEIMDEAGFLEHEIERNPDRAPLRELVSDVKTQSGREHAARRTSLSKLNQPKGVRGLDKLSNEGLCSLVEYATRPQSSEPSGPREDKMLNELDAHYAQELLRKLPKIVSRVVTLDALDLSVKVPKNVSQYFEEAHRCYLYGFPVACAVVCRAILESALVDTIDPDREVKRLLEGEARKPEKLKQSYIERLVKEAENARILTDDRPACAIEVRDAGNDAIHNFEAFRQHWEGKLGDVLDKTRKVLEDLYRSRESG